MREPMERDEAEGDLDQAASIVRDVLYRKIAPAWLWKRNEAGLKTALEELELAVSSMVMDEPYGAEEEADV